MYAIAKIGGMQFKLQKGEKIAVPRMNQKKVGDTIEIAEVLLLNDGNKSYVGQPFVEKSKVIAEVIDHIKDDKVTVYKKKRRKGYSVKHGHRQLLTEILITDIIIQTKTSHKKDAVKGKIEEVPAEGESADEVLSEEAIEETDLDENAEEPGDSDLTDDTAKSSHDES
ncbi:50S ribosomal protein L21 [bacterium]|nr:50S ribosomal protein L21 [bacterium]